MQIKDHENEWDCERDLNNNSYSKKYMKSRNANGGRGIKRRG